MMRRSDEEAIKNSIQKYLKSNFPEINIFEGEDPPDYYVKIHGNRIPLEVTRAEIEYIENGERKSFETDSEALFRLIENLNTKYSVANNDYKLHIHLVGPIDNFGKFILELKSTIDQFIRDSDKYEINVWNYFIIRGEKVGICKSSNMFEPIFLIPFVGPKKKVASSLIQEQTDNTYSYVIEKKEKKMGSFTGEKWLGIYNSYILSEEHNIKHSLNKFRSDHTFTRIFVVMGDGRVFDYP